MNSTAEGRKPTRWYAMEQALAPHVDKKWAQNLILELRLLGVQGARIGAALSEVESHCSESGQGAEQTFGDPVEYARSLALPVDDDHSPAAVMRSLVPMMVQVAGMFVLNWSFGAWLGGQSLDITTGHLLIAVFALVGMVAVVRLADSWLRMAVYHQVRSAILMLFAYLGITATCVAAIKFLDEAIWRGSAGWGLAVGAATLVAGVVWAIARLRAHGPDDDPILSPFQNADASPSDKATSPLRRLSRYSLLATFPYVALVPLGTLVLLAMDLVLHQMGAQ
jgi:hypothetical protein